MTFGGSLAAQQTAWIQIEAQPTLAEAQQRASFYASRIEDVNGFYLGSGWYAIALGPYGRTDGEALAARLRASGAIPRDSYVADGDAYGQRFWPVGGAAALAAQPAESVTAVTVTVTETVEETPTPVAIEEPDETIREARNSEALLTREERENLQRALQWAGHYDAAIDGAFGRGTRRSMEDWQVANGYPATGVLTTRQRAALTASYNAVLDGLGLQTLREAAAGIQMPVPTGILAFDAYEPPFARFEATGDIPARLLMISQPGNQDRLFGLYEILQTLEIMPPDGPRQRRANSFEIEGRDAGTVSYATATLDDGAIKGFILVWPSGDEDRRSRVLAEMNAGFEAIDGVLDPGIAPPNEDQAIDLVSGLAVRKPQVARSGFFIDPQGAVLTTLEAVQSCESVTIAEDQPAEVALRDEALGIAVLRPREVLAPIGIAVFQTEVPRLQTDVAVGGYPYGGVLGVPTLTFGTLADLRGLNGEQDIKRLSLIAQPGDAGGPVFDAGGAVLGMLLPSKTTGGQVLPPEVSFTVDAEAILAALGQAGIATETTNTLAYMAPETLTLRAADMTVLVNCW